MEGEEGVDGTAAEWVHPAPGIGKGTGGSGNVGDRNQDNRLAPGVGGGLGGGGGKARRALGSRTGGGGLGAAFDAVDAREIVGLMSKIMKVRGGWRV